MAFELRYYTKLILNKDDIEFVTQFPCLLGHPVCKQMKDELKNLVSIRNTGLPTKDGTSETIVCNS